MGNSSKSPKGKLAPRPKDRLTVRLPRALLATLRRWATKEQAPVSALVEEAVAQLCEELQRRRTARFQKAKLRRKTQRTAPLRTVPLRTPSFNGPQNPSPEDPQ